MGMQDRDYVRARKFDYSSKRDNAPDLSKLDYFKPTNKKRWLYVIAWFAFVALVLWYGATH